ncbi:hypothetical protein KSS87_002200 [Heliosperma pusillum]|nr:hypothetical protein KSS87_002200 [Heliosperma pusillum]
MLVHGREGGETRKRSRHMLSVSSDSPTAVVVPRDSPRTCFFKDGRKISVGDCALFKPAQDSPTSVGIIYSFTPKKESNLTLGVKWLYRPAKVKLLKGVALEALPNEVFYSFLLDEIPAASLLHPCKVAFLPKGAELPPGAASFVCRRVYDITNKCLWWLSDQDFIDERQEEVDKLLRKTHLDMHASLDKQQGPHSSNGLAATSTQKHSPDGVQNSSSYVYSKPKGKKRDRGDQSSEITKRERNARGEDGDSCQLRSERFLNLEIAKVAERGGLADSEAVAKLVHLMQPERSQRKIDLAGRSMLAGIIAATDKPDYLSQFIQLRGLVVLDEWLQEVHKGKIGSSGNVKDSDKSVESFILVLLCALVKLPVNLNALQMCNIGKSVNYLRSHKNSEIQQKARSLVDTWKKRVEAEMTLSDAKPGSTHPVPSPGRSRDGFHGIGSYKNPSSVKSSSVKLAQGETKLKSGSAYQSNVRTALAHVAAINNCNDEQSRIFDYGGSSEAALIVAREEKSSVSSHLHSDSQCSSDHDKYLVPCGKDESKRSTTSSKSADKTIGSDSRQCRHGKITNRSPAEKNDRLVHVGNFPEENYQKLIVKIPTRVHGLAQSIVRASAEDPSSRNSRASSPSLSETCNKSDATLRGKHNSNKSDEAGGLSAAEHQRTSDTRRSPDVSKAACSPAMNEVKSRTGHDSAFGPLNALIESCIMLSEADLPMSVGDDIGIKLLASVAVGEISDFGIVSPAVSPHRPSNSDIVLPAGKDSNISSVVSNINDGESTQHLGIPHEDLNQKAEDCLRDNGISVEHITIPCTRGTVADANVEVVNDKEGGGKDECCNQLPVSSKPVANDVEAKDRVNNVSLSDKFDSTADRDTTYPSVNKDDDVKNNVCVEPESLSPMEQNSRSVSLYSESGFTDEVPVISSRTSRHVVAVRATINVVKPTSVDHCDHANEEGNKRTVQGNVPSQIHEKQENFGMRCVDVSTDTGSKDENLDRREAFLQQSCHSSTQLCSSSVVLTDDLHSSTKESNFQGQRKEDSGSMTVNTGSFSATGGSVVKTKHIFDLNEGLNADDGNPVEPVNGVIDPCNAIVCPVDLSQNPIASASGGLLTSTTIKKPFVPTPDLLSSKTELGWKGPASTSAFRPAEPRKMPELLPCVSGAPHPDGGACKQARQPLDFDLNVADESVDQESEFELNSICKLETTSSLHSRGGLDLDLNKIEGSDMVQQSASENLRNEISIPPVKVSSSSIFLNGEASGKMDFDLNDGPAIEKLPVEQTSYSQLGCNNNPLQSSFGPRFYNSNAGNVIAWNPPGTSYSVSVSPSGLPDRKTFSVGGIGGGPHRFMGGSTSGLSFYPDTYRGSVLASSPALPFQHAPFQYPVFGFRPGFPPLTSALASGQSGYVDPITNGRISAIPSQLVGNAAAVSFQYPYGFPHSVPDIGNNGVFDNSQKWGNQGLDLNSGPGGVDLEGIDRSMPTVSRQVSAISSQPLVEEQAMMYSMGGGLLKRKESDGGSSMDKLNFKQPSWWR